jgi:hypothetical protein
MSPISLMSESWEILEECGYDAQTLPSPQQSVIDLSMIDPILLEMDDRSRQASFDELHAPVSPQEPDLHGIAPIFLDDEEECQVETLQRRDNATWYLVKWEGLPHEENTWQKPNDVSPELVTAFEATYKYKGNHLGVMQLLKKRVWRKRVEYWVQWMGRPASDNSWQGENTLSRERIIEFENLSIYEIEKE